MAIIVRIWTPVVVPKTMGEWMDWYWEKLKSTARAGMALLQDEISLKRAILDSGLISPLITEGKDGSYQVGHASLEIENHSYTSLYPKSRISEGQILESVPGYYLADVMEDITKLERGPDFEITFTKLNESAMQKYINKYQKESNYHLASRNCCTHVGEALRIGAEQKMDQMSFWDFATKFARQPLLTVGGGYAKIGGDLVMWTPATLSDYARALHHLVEKET